VAVDARRRREWINYNPILKKNDLAIDLNDNSLRLGDGLTRWLDLPVFLIKAQEPVTQLDLDSAINAAIESLVNSAPGTLDTLGELAEQLASDEDASTALATAVAGKLTKASNLSDLENVATAKTNLSLVKGDVGLANVDNTSDANKPVSTAQQTALDLKAPLSSPALTGNPTAPTQSAGDNSTKVATTAYADAAIAAQHSADNSIYIQRLAGSTSPSATLPFLNVRDYGAKGDRRVVMDAAMTNGSATLTSATAAFTQADEGKHFAVIGAGTAGVPLYGTIQTYIDPTQVVLSVTAGTTVSAKKAWLATNDSAAIQAAIDACSVGGFGEVVLPGGWWLANVVMKHGVHLRGMGRGTHLCAVPGSATHVVGSPTDGTTFLYEALVNNMTVLGHKDLGCTGDGIFLAPNHQNSSDLDALVGYTDPCLQVRDVHVLYAGQDGVRIDQATGSGPGSSRAGGDSLVNVYTVGAKRHGFNIRRYDVNLVNCSAGLSGQHGFHLDTANAKLTGCKAWYGGNDVWPTGDPRSVTSTLQSGFYIPPAATGNQLTGCESQDNYGYGVEIDGGSSNSVKAHTCGGNSVTGLYLHNGATGKDLDLMMVKADNPAGLYGVLYDGAATNGNRVRLGIGNYGDAVTGAGSRLFHFQNGALPSSNELEWAYAHSLSAYGDVSGTIAFYPFSAERFTFRMVGDTAVAAMNAGDAYPGQEITVVATQDNIGGRTLTFDAGTFKGAPALAGAGLTGGKVSTFRFLNISTTDTPSWIYLSGTQGM